MTVDWSTVDVAEGAGGSRQRRQAERAAAALFVVAAAEFATLVVTGVLLLLFYRPSAAQAGGDSRSGRHYAFTAVGLLRLAHRATARAMVVTLLALAVAGVVLAVSRPSRPRRHRFTAAAGIGAAVMGLVASYTGFLLPWDQLALWAVRVGTNMMGYRPIISGGSNVRYVLIGGSQISLSTMRWWLLIHVVLAPAVLMALGGLMAWRVRGHRPARHTGLGS